MKRTFNIINRAVNAFDMEIDMSESLQAILDEAMNVIEENVEYDYICECERGRHYDHISWNDGKGFDIESDGEFVSGDDKHNKYFRKDEHGVFSEIEWYEHEDSDYVLMDKVIDTDGMVVLLVSK